MAPDYKCVIIIAVFVDFDLLVPFKSEAFFIALIYHVSIADQGL